MRATLAELMIVAAAEAFRGAGEVLATGIGPLPRLAAGLAKLTFTPELMLTDGEAYLVEEPVPLGKRDPKQAAFVGTMPYARVFDCLWGGKRHAMVTPVQIDRFGQANLSALGDFHKPKVAMLGLRGFPGNSICHANSMVIPNHSTRTFVAGEVDVVSSAGFNPRLWPKGMTPTVEIGRIVTDLCVFDFGGPNHAARLISLHPGVAFAEVAEKTGFPLLDDGKTTVTALPTDEQLALIAKLDPHNIRASVLKNDPPALKAA